MEEVADARQIEEHSPVFRCGHGVARVFVDCNHKLKLLAFRVEIEDAYLQSEVVGLREQINEWVSARTDLACALGYTLRAPSELRRAHRASYPG